MRALTASVVGAFACALCAEASPLVLAERGKASSCTIIVEKGAGPTGAYAAEELVTFVRVSTGVTLPVLSAGGTSMISCMGLVGILCGVNAATEDGRDADERMASPGLEETK